LEFFKSFVRTNAHTNAFGPLASSAALVDQKPFDQIHESSSVGARPSSAAPVNQNHDPITHEGFSAGAPSIDGAAEDALGYNPQLINVGQTN